MCVCTYVRMYVCTYVRIYVFIYICMYVFVCMYACMYMCMCVCMHICIMHLDVSYPRMAWEARYEGRRTRGRPRTKWQDNIQNALLEK
jgi:hypothetical protein